jgi:hypothetical protein
MICGIKGKLDETGARLQHSPDNNNDSNNNNNRLHYQHLV